MKETKKPRPVKVYTLFGYPHALTCQSRYSRGMPITIVAAYSVRQAYWLGGNDEWFKGNVGILERTVGEQWKDFDGNLTYGGRFGTGATYPLSKSFMAEYKATHDKV